MTGCLLMKPGGPPWLERYRHRLRFRWQALRGIGAGRGNRFAAVAAGTETVAEEALSARVSRLVWLTWLGRRCSRAAGADAVARAWDVHGEINFAPQRTGPPRPVRCGPVPPQ